MSKNLLGLFFLFTTVSCVNYQLTPDVVSRSDAQKQQYVVLGTIKDITTVTIEGDREAGAVAGALIGGVFFSIVGFFFRNALMIMIIVALLFAVNYGYIDLTQIFGVAK